MQGARVFARTQDTRYQLGVWVGQLGSDRVDVVTVPRDGQPPSLLWSRFAAAIRIDPGLCHPPESPVNKSLGLASTELLRLVNSHLVGLTRAEYNATVKDYLAIQVLSPRCSREPEIRMNEATYRATLSWNRCACRAITSAGCMVRGDLADLAASAVAVPTAPDGRGDRVDDEDLLAAAEDALAGLKVLVRRRKRRLRQKGMTPKPTGVAWSSPSDRFASASPVQASVRDIVALVHEANGLRRALTNRNT
jgi:hypothetical protein